MRTVKRLFSILLVTCLVSACQTAWWQRMRADPIAELSHDVGYILNAASLAETAFAAFVEAAPGAVSAGTQATFRNIVGSVRQGVALAQDGLTTAAHLRQGSPNVETLLGDARNASRDLSAFLAGLQAPPGSAASPLLAAAVRATAQAGRASL